MDETYKQMEERQLARESKIWAANVRDKYSDKQLSNFSMSELLTELAKSKNFYLQKELAKRAGMLEVWENSRVDLYHRPIFRIMEKFGVAAEYGEKEREYRQNKK